MSKERFLKRLWLYELSIFYPFLSVSIRGLRFFNSILKILKKAPFLSCGHLTPGGGKKKHPQSYRRWCCAAFPPPEGNTRGGI